MQCNDLLSWKIKGKTKKASIPGSLAFCNVKTQFIVLASFKKNILTFSSGGNGYFWNCEDQKTKNNFEIQVRVLCREEEIKLTNLWKRQYVRGNLFIEFPLIQAHKLLKRNQCDLLFSINYVIL